MKIEKKGMDQMKETDIIISFLEEMNVDYDMFDDSFFIHNEKVFIDVWRNENTGMYHCEVTDRKKYEETAKKSHLYIDAREKAIITEKKYKTLKGVKGFIRKYYFNN